MPPPEPQLGAEERAALERGVALFNDGYFFECHDVLEELWSGVRGPARDFFQGLIQVAVGYYHLGNANPDGAASLFGRALKRLEGYPERYLGFDVAAQRRELVALLERRARPPDPAAHPPPRWRLEPCDPSGGSSA